MPRPSRRLAKQKEMPINNTVKLTESLRDRVAKAMGAEGFTVWSEFCRVALTEKCLAIERNLRSRDPHEYSRLYGRDGRDGSDGDGRHAPRSASSLH
jgi:hypothetical protein